MNFFRKDGTFVIIEDGYPYHLIPKMGEKYEIIKKEFEEHPENFEEDIQWEPSIELKQEMKRAERDSYITKYIWRIERYNQQIELGTTTDDSKEEYLLLLEYIQLLRDFPETENWEDKIIMNYEDFKFSKGK